MKENGWGNEPGNALIVEGLQRKLGPLTFWRQSFAVEARSNCNLPNAMTEAPLHIVFTPSGAGSLRQALADVGSDVRVISFFDDLSFGPINPSDPKPRAQWVEDELGWTEFLDVTAASPAFWDEVLNTTRRRIIWTSRRSAKEYAGFLECIWRLGELPCDVIDLTNYKTSNAPEAREGPSIKPREAVSLGMILPHQFNDDALYDTAAPLSAVDRDRHKSLWIKLRNDNAALRVIKDGLLTSAPISYFDPLLMSEIRPQWLKVARIVGRALSAQDDDKIWQTSDLFLAGRIHALATEGRVEFAGGTPFDMRHSEVRLPQP